MCKVCDRCKGVMNYDPYFDAEVCSNCGKMERKRDKEELKEEILLHTQRVSILRQMVGVKAI